MNSWHSYASIYNIGHAAVADLLKAPVRVDEKVDGSQFSFGLIDGELRIRSKGAVMVPDAPEKMFTKAAESVKERLHLLHPDWTYRGEYLAKPKHNALAYDRVPQGHIILFDINPGEEAYLSHADVRAEAERIGLEAVPLLFEGTLTLEIARTLIDQTTSVLGGQPIEGIVVKQQTVTLFGADKKALMAKFVSERFKEVHKTNWKLENPGAKDIVALLADAYRTSARWQKAVQHLREAGQIEDSPRDIGALMREVPEDIKRECEAEMKERLFGWAWPHVRRAVTRGLPEWYKDELLRRGFEKDGGA